MASFDDQVKAFAKKASISVEKTIKGTSIKLFSAVIKSSPVDTGRFRANWTAAGVQPSTVTTDMTDKSGSAATGAMANYINSAKGQLVFTMANNLPYAYKLEYGGYPGDGPNTVGGFSKQAPQGFVRVNVARFEAILDEQARANR
jgi:hypothetical protein